MPPVSMMFLLRTGRRRLPARQGKTVTHSRFPLQHGTSMSASEGTRARAKEKRLKSTATPRKGTPDSVPARKKSGENNNKEGRQHSGSAKKLNMFHYFGGGGGGLAAAAAAPRTPVKPKQQSKTATRGGNSSGGSAAKIRCSGSAAREGMCHNYCVHTCVLSPCCCV